MMRKYRDIEYTLKRSSRKTASIYIERDGQVTLLVPQALTDSKIEALLESKSTSWGRTLPSGGSYLLYFCGQMSFQG